MEKNPRRKFIAIYKKLSLPLTKFIAKRVGAKPEVIDEVFAKTIYAAWKGFNTFEHKSSYFTWLCRIALNKTADYYRDQVNQNSRFITPTLKDIANLQYSGLNPEERFSLKELCNSVNHCLNLLPYQKRRLLHLRYWKELSIAQIAKTLGTSEKAVEGKLYRAKKELARIFEKEGLNYGNV